MHVLPALPAAAPVTMQGSEPAPAAPCRNLLLLGAVGAPAVGLAGPYALFFVPPRCAAAMRRCGLALEPSAGPSDVGRPRPHYNAAPRPA